MKKRIVMTITGLLALLLFFLSTDPQKVPSVLLILPFMIVFGLLFYVVRAVIERRTANARYAQRIALLCAALPTLLLVLQSIGQLTVRDVVTVGVLFLLSYFYLSRTIVAR